MKCNATCSTLADHPDQISQTPKPQASCAPSYINHRSAHQIQNVIQKQLHGFVPQHSRTAQKLNTNTLTQYAKKVKYDMFTMVQYKPGARFTNIVARHVVCQNFVKLRYNRLG